MPLEDVGARVRAVELGVDAVVDHVHPRRVERRVGRRGRPRRIPALTAMTASARLVRGPLGPRREPVAAAELLGLPRPLRLQRVGGDHVRDVVQQLRPGGRPGWRTRCGSARGRRASPTPAAIDRSAERIRSAALAPVEPRVVLGVRGRALARLAHAVHVDVDEPAQLADEEVDVHPGAAVDVGRVLPGEDRGSHGVEPSRFAWLVRSGHMARVLSIVLAGGEGKRLMPLTVDRAKPAVPFGGSYRLIDFVLSNLVNAGYTSIAVLTQYKSHSLDRHISLTWRLSTMLGHYVAPVPAQQRLGPRWYQGSADAIYQSMNLINDERPDYVVVFGADHVYRMDASQMVAGAHRVRRRRDGGRHPGAAQGGLAVRGDQDRRRRRHDRRVPGEAGRPARARRLPRRVVRLDGQLRLHRRRARRGARARRRTTSRPGTTWAATSSRCSSTQGQAAVYDFKRNDVPGRHRPRPRLLARRRDASTATTRRTWTWSRRCRSSTSTTTAWPIFTSTTSCPARSSSPARRCATRSSAPARSSPAPRSTARCSGVNALRRRTHATRPAVGAAGQRHDRRGRGRPQRDPRQERRRPRRRPDRRRPRRGPAPRLHRQRGRRHRHRQGLTASADALPGQWRHAHPPLGPRTRPARPSAGPRSSPTTSARLVDAGFRVTVEESAQRVFDRSRSTPRPAPRSRPTGSWVDAPGRRRRRRHQGAPRRARARCGTATSTSRTRSRARATRSPCSSGSARGGGTALDIEYLTDEQRQAGRRLRLLGGVRRRRPRRAPPRRRARRAAAADGQARPRRAAAGGRARPGAGQLLALVTGARGRSGTRRARRARRRPGCRSPGGTARRRSDLAQAGAARPRPARQLRGHPRCRRRRS